MHVNNTIFVHNDNSLYSCGEGWGEVDKNLFDFYKENNHVDGGELHEQVRTGELLYNNQDCSIKPKSRCQKKDLGNYQVQAAAAVGRLLLRVSCSKRSKMRQEQSKAGCSLLWIERTAIHQRRHGQVFRKWGWHWTRPLHRWRYMKRNKSETECQETKDCLLQNIHSCQSSCQPHNIWILWLLKCQ